MSTDRAITVEVTGQPGRPTKLAAALAELQTQLPAVPKTKTADAGTYKYKYADLSDVTRMLMPLLGKLGLSFTARPTFVGDRFVLAYKLLHESGECEEGEYPLPNASPQAVGSAITYARRYALCALTGVAAEEDDDARLAQGESKPRRGQRRRETEPEYEPDSTDNAHGPSKSPPEWDPVEQAALFDGWAAEIRKAANDAELDSIGKRVLVARNKGDMSPNTHRKLGVLAGERKAELNGAQADGT